MRKIVLLFALTIVFIPVMAQKEGDQSLITQEQVNRINELVKPLKEQIESMLNKDETGNYKAYQEEIRKNECLKKL